MFKSLFKCYPVEFILVVFSSFREKGGAYGAGAKSSAGVFSFSYWYDFELKLIWQVIIFLGTLILWKHSSHLRTV